MVKCQDIAKSALSRGGTAERYELRIDFDAVYLA
jgi:hypothetical protein